jgi:hypothetical protein
VQPKRLEQLLSHVLDRRTERAERRRLHIAESHKRATEADAKLKRLYDAIENGVADLSDPLLKYRIGELKATRDQARLDAERAEGAIERAGPTITPEVLKTFARAARKRRRTDGGGYRRDHLRALAQRVEVDKKELRIMGSSCARSSPPQAQKRRVLACPVLYALPERQKMARHDRRRWAILFRRSAMIRHSNRRYCAPGRPQTLSHATLRGRFGERFLIISCLLKGADDDRGAFTHYARPNRPGRQARHPRDPAFSRIRDRTDGRRMEGSRHHDELPWNNHDDLMACLAYARDTLSSEKVFPSAA